MKTLIITIFMTSLQSLAFVSGPSTVNEGENQLSVGIQREQGKVEPNENRASFQDAQIDVQKIRYVRGVESQLGLSRTNIYLEYGAFKSAKEQVGSNLFYEEDQGSYFTLGLSSDFVHELEKQFGFYFQITPHRIYNKNKFSNPRIDQFAIGLTSAFNVTDNLFQKNLIHIGSGDGSTQNSYLAVDTGFGYRLNHLLAHPVSIFSSLFLEADTTERTDPSYDAIFSAPDRKDRIRSFKYGTIVGIDTALNKDFNLSFNSLQKLGGYDARSTQIYSLNLGLKF